MNLALCPHAANYILHKMGLATCWLAIYADDERWMEVFHCITVVPLFFQTLHTAHTLYTHPN